MKKSRVFLAISLIIMLVLSGCTDIGPVSVNINSGSGETGAVSENDTAAVKEAESTAEKNGEIYVLYTSDIHCGVDKGFGLAGLYEYRKSLEDQGYTTILVDDGDAVQGEVMGTLTGGEAMIRLMNAMDYDVAIPGNHEFDYGMEQFFKNVELAEHPYISCNFNKEGELVLKPYEIIEAAGKKIAFIGITTPESLTSSSPAYFQDDKGNFIYGFMEGENGKLLYDAVQKAVDDARAEGADYVYVMAHMGMEETSRPYTYVDVISNTTGIDVFLDGHSHDTRQVVMKNKAGKNVTRSAVGTKLNSIGYSHITDGGIEETNILSWPDTNPVSLVSMMRPDNPVSRAVAQEEAEIEEAVQYVVAATDVDLTINDAEAKDENGQPLRMVRRAETNIGDLCTDAFRIMTNSDIGIINGGAFRAGLKKGEITFKDLLSVFSSSNDVVVIEATGQQLLDALEWGARDVPDENGGFLHVSGMTYEIDSTIDDPCTESAEHMMTGVEGRRRVRNVMVGEEPIDPERKYKVAGVRYLILEHGDGQTAFDGAKVLNNDAGVDNELLTEYIIDLLGGSVGEEYEDPSGQGRIVITE